jgi:predicted MFS family arabinose efflux permease
VTSDRDGCKSEVRSQKSDLRVAGVILHPSSFILRVEPVSASGRASTLAPFEVRSFRYQWPADLATSWAFEMEVIILGWYILVETQSVFMLTVWASLQYIGTLIAPLFGVAGDRLGHRRLVAGMRTVYACCAATLMTLAFTGLVAPAAVLVVATVMGLVRPSDIGMRQALVAETMPPGRLIGAMGVQRTTLDSARVAGALSGAGLFALIGMGPTYVVVTVLYAISVFLTLKAGAYVEPAPARAGPEPVRLSPWRELKEGIAYVWNTPLLLAIMCLAVLLNMTTFPMMNHLLPYVAKEVYVADQKMLGYLVAGGALGAMVTSLLLSRLAHRIRAGRVSIIGTLMWYAALIAFAWQPGPWTGIPLLMLAGCAQSVSQVPSHAVLLRNSDERFRGRIMGIRMLAIYGNVPGLLLFGPVVAALGFPATATLYCGVGVAITICLCAYWRAALWQRDAPANTR